MVALLFPQCLGGPYAALSAYLHDDWLMQILQERSVWQRPEFVFSHDMLGATVQFVGVGALAVVALRNRRHNRGLVVFAMFALLAAVLGILYSRNIRYLPIFAGPGILLVLAALLPPLRAKGSLLATSLDLDFRPLALLAPGLSLAALVIGLTAALARTAAPIPAAELAGSCGLERLSAYQWPPTAHIMAPPDLAIRLLPKLSAGTSVVAVPYHTAAAGLERAYRFLDPATHDPQAFLGASAATHVVLCAWPAGPSAALEALYPFAASLMEGRAPAWLQECPAGAGSPVRIYRYPAAGSPGTICPSTSG